MSNDVVLETLRGLHFDPEASSDYLEKLAAIAEFADLEQDMVIFREGDAPTHLYLIVNGAVALEIGIPGQPPKRIHTVGETELLGWSPILNGERMTATARTLQPTRAIKIGGQQLLAVCEHDPKFGYEFMRRTALALAKRLTATRMQLLDVYRHELLDSPHDRPEG